MLQADVLLFCSMNPLCSSCFTAQGVVTTVVDDLGCALLHAGVKEVTKGLLDKHDSYPHAVLGLRARLLDVGSRLPGQTPADVPE